MKNETELINILLADDDLQDCHLVEKALKRSRLRNGLKTVHDGQELLDYLRRRGKYADPASAPRPGVILLDLNMPRLDGRAALEKIKADPDLCKIPVVVLTTSESDEDITRTYKLGVSGYVTKPVTLPELVKVMEGLNQYWFEIVKLPPKEE